MTHRIMCSCLLGLVASALLLTGCDSDDGDAMDNGVVVGESAFQAYLSWQEVDYTIDGTPGLGNAHQGELEDYARRIFMNPTALSSSGERYDEGSIIVKETFSYNAAGNRVLPAGGALLAMVKRGGDFNPAAAGWEWFELGTDGTILARGGAEMMAGACNGCHGAAPGYGGLDYVFHHPAEVVADAARFSGFENWTRIAETVEDHDFLQSAHQSSSGNALRRVYKKQEMANPDQGDYPVGTTLVKSVELDGSILEITGMVKRGAGFNPAAGDWEWFMLDPADHSITARGGADMLDGMCNGCHTHANPEEGYGLDFVFHHPGDAFNSGGGYVAQPAHLSDYRDWQQVDYTIDASNGLGTAHMGGDALFSRRVFANRPLDPVSNQYPVGTVLVKETFTFDESGNWEWPEQMGVLAMAKRGAGFNPGAGDWEWLVLSNDGTQITGRGGMDMLNGMCNGCHAAATTYDGFDFVFQHPGRSSFGINDLLLYGDWSVVGEATGDHDFLNSAHGGADATRRVYKKQLDANPEPVPGDETWPTGTMFVKEVWVDGSVLPARAGMIKRSGDFNPEGGGWEYVMFEGDGTILVQGGSETSCSSCHSHANRGEGYGLDWVFSHADDPFNN